MSKISILKDILAQELAGETVLLDLGKGHRRSAAASRRSGADHC
jgi:hypothetical protein